MYGIDLGCGYIKAVGRDRLMFPSLVSSARERQLVSEGTNDQYEVEINGEHYFVGELARREGLNVAASIDSDLSANLYNRVKLLAALHQLVDRDCSVSVVTGLCISDFVRLKHSFAQMLRGYYNVRIGTSTISGPALSLQ